MINENTFVFSTLKLWPECPAQSFHLSIVGLEVMLIISIQKSQVSLAITYIPVSDMSIVLREVLPFNCVN